MSSQHRTRCNFCARVHTPTLPCTEAHPHTLIRTHARAHGVCRHNSGSVASMAAAPRQTVQRGRDISDRGEGTKHRERCGQNLQRDKGAHNHTRETGLAAVMRRGLRALADVLRHPTSCTQTHQNPALHAHAGEPQRWSASCGHPHATELPRVRPSYALGRLARPAPFPNTARTHQRSPNPAPATNARAPAAQTCAARPRTRHAASPARPGRARARQARHRTLPPLMRPIPFWVGWCVVLSDTRA
jgi:hypothetical protein